MARKVKVTGGMTMTLDGFTAGLNQSTNISRLEPIEVSGTGKVTHVRYKVLQ